MPKYQELSVKSILEEVKTDSELMKYIDYYEDEKIRPERNFFFLVLGTLRPQYLKDAIHAAN